MLFSVMDTRNHTCDYLDRSRKFPEDDVEIRSNVWMRYPVLYTIAQHPFIARIPGIPLTEKLDPMSIPVACTTDL